MPPDVNALVAAMARREAAAALLAAPRVEFGAPGPSVRVRLVECPTCGALPGPRSWTPPFTAEASPGPVLRMLACETVTARAVLPVVALAERLPGPHRTVFQTRALTWLDATRAAPTPAAALDLGATLAAVDAAEGWITDPDVAGRTLPASTRPCLSLDGGWPEHRARLVPSFLSPHAAVPAPLEGLYEQEFRASIVHGYALAGAPA
ncbi:hypothetical protein AGRA3207_003343 [Actinomadura graeca]|uniref:Uncharacterized protein n=1 Tax=Actinomadura graeca TaxID=2750812 RepID=A0ABX8QVZ0_9ACTN|nr:hypothetical protein [Actinomadura graeca]QXJ22354.1 hypothetical protein AGRA3207_003343 [Actinomadura graeca]